MRRSAAKNKEKLSYSEKFTRLGVRLRDPEWRRYFKIILAGKAHRHPAAAGPDNRRPGCHPCVDRILGLRTGNHSADPGDARWISATRQRTRPSIRSTPPGRWSRRSWCSACRPASPCWKPASADRAKPSTCWSNAYSTPACADSSITHGDTRSCSARATASSAGTIPTTPPAARFNNWFFLQEHHGHDPLRRAPACRCWPTGSSSSPSPTAPRPSAPAR